MVTPMTGSVWATTWGTLSCSAQRAGEAVGCEVESAGVDGALLTDSPPICCVGVQPMMKANVQAIEPTTTYLERAEGFPVIMTLLAALIRPSLRATKVAHYKARSLV